MLHLSPLGSLPYSPYTGYNFSAPASSCAQANQPTCPPTTTTCPTTKPTCPPTTTTCPITKPTCPPTTTTCPTTKPTCPTTTCPTTKPTCPPISDVDDHVYSCDAYYDTYPNSYDAVAFSY